MLQRTELKQNEFEAVIWACVNKSSMSLTEGHRIDLNLTSIIIWSGPGDRKLPQQGWRFLQQDLQTLRLRSFNSLLPLSHTDEHAHMFGSRAHKYVCMRARVHRHIHTWMGPHTQAHTWRRQQSRVSWRDTLAFQQPGSLDRSGPHTLVLTKKQKTKQNICLSGRWFQSKSTVYIISTFIDKVFLECIMSFVSFSSITYIIYTYIQWMEFSFFRPFKWMTDSWIMPILCNEIAITAQFLSPPPS